VLFLEVWYGKFTKDRITILASGIVYTTLISIVPFVSFLVAFLPSSTSCNHSMTPSRKSSHPSLVKPQAASLPP
jgi:uncharacterized BrkB/YihY/UPF0761 family membrane protein